jgi:excisionase family DNA binding protein
MFRSPASDGGVVGQPRDSLYPQEKCGKDPAAKRTEAEAEIPIGVREAARLLGVSRQTVYLYVERKQIPHFRVMGRSIRFLKSELLLFRATFKQEVVEWQGQ